MSAKRNSRVSFDMPTSINMNGCSDRKCPPEMFNEKTCGESACTFYKRCLTNSQKEINLMYRGQND